MQERTLVIGARRRRQGIGGYVARALQAAGCNVCAVMGTTIPSARQARDELSSAGIEATPYDDLAKALARERPQIVAVCSPYTVHREQLNRVAEAGANCLCEKPLWWGPTASRAEETAALVGAFEQAGRYLDLITQWPRTLSTYRQLFGWDAGEAIVRFEMRLSPVATGAAMVLDSAPHLLSMLWALVGAGTIERPGARFAAGDHQLTLDFAYHHASGAVAVTCEMVTCEDQPRPAWYGINARVALREVDMPGYRLRLRARDGSGAVALPDPLPMHVRSFVEAVRSGARTDADRLVSSMTQLATLYEAARRAL